VLSFAATQHSLEIGIGTVVETVAALLIANVDRPYGGWSGNVNDVILNFDLCQYLKVDVVRFKSFFLFFSFF
jgi:hypothetical protein